MYPRFAARVPTWALPSDGRVADLITEVVRMLVLFMLFLKPGGCWKRVRLTEKTPAHLVHGRSSVSQFNPRIWKRPHVECHQLWGSGEAKKEAFASGRLLSNVHVGKNGDWLRALVDMHSPTPAGTEHEATCNKFVHSGFA